MVFFACNRCGDSLKKNKVDQHVQGCRTNTITCMDCLKDFKLNEYSSHTECISEDQKYGGPNYKTPNHKGKNKQNEWIKKIKSLIEENKYPNNISAILNSLLKYENIPRKKAKFSNFIKNSFKIRDENLIEKIWSIFEESIKNGKNNDDVIPSFSNQHQSKENNNFSSNIPNQIQLNVEETMEPEASPQANQELSEEPDQGKVKMKKIIVEIIKQRQQGILLKKLRKKVLKNYHNLGYDDDSIIIDKFERTIVKKKFINNNDVITLAN